MADELQIRNIHIWMVSLLSFSYILATLNFDNSTISNCVKILIRIARTSELSVDSIIAHGALMDNVFGVFNHTPLSTEGMSLHIIIVYL